MHYNTRAEYLKIVLFLIRTSKTGVKASSSKFSKHFEAVFFLNLFLNYVGIGNLETRQYAGKHWIFLLTESPLVLHQLLHPRWSLLHINVLS